MLPCKHLDEETSARVADSDGYTSWNDRFAAENCRQPCHPVGAGRRASGRRAVSNELDVCHFFVGGFWRRHLMQQFGSEHAPRDQASRRTRKEVAAKVRRGALQLSFYRGAEEHCACRLFGSVVPGTGEVALCYVSVVMRIWTTRPFRWKKQGKWSRYELLKFVFSTTRCCLVGLASIVSHLRSSVQH